MSGGKEVSDEEIFLYLQNYFHIRKRTWDSAVEMNYRPLGQFEDCLEDDWGFEYTYEYIHLGQIWNGRSWIKNEEGIIVKK